MKSLMIGGLTASVLLVLLAGILGQRARDAFGDETGPETVVPFPTFTNTPKSPVVVSTATSIPPTAIPPTATPVVHQSFEEMRRSAGLIGYEELARDIERFRDSLIYLKAEISQVIYYDDGPTGLLARMMDAGNRWDSSTVLIVIPSDNPFRPLEDDIIEVVAQVVNMYTYTTVMGSENTVPLLTAISVRLFDEALLVEQSDGKVSISATQLIDEYEHNEVAADRNYKWEVIVVTGTIDEIAENYAGEKFVTLPHETDSWEWTEVKCFFDAMHSEMLASFHPGQVVTFKGYVMGMPSTTIELRGCNVLSRN